MIVRRGLAIVLSLVLSAAALALAPGASARDGEPAKDKDPCSDGATVKLRVVLNEDNRLETTGVVWSNDDDIWDWKFKHNGDISFEGDVKANDQDGEKSFKIQRTMVNLDGPDFVVFRADNRVTGQTCRAELYY